MTFPPLRRLSSSLLSLSFLPILLFAGCASPAQQASKIDRAIHDQTAQINRSAASAQTHIASADRHVQAAATQPSNPVETNTLLADAHQDLAAAQSDLAPIAPAAAVIEKRSTEHAELTAKVQGKLEDERDHWVGYKGRVALWTLAGLSLLASFITFMIRTNGGGPILAAVGEIAGNLIGAVWSYVIKPVGTLLFHVGTFGAAKLADVTNKHYDAQEEARKTAAAADAVKLVDLANGH